MLVGDVLRRRYYIKLQKVYQHRAEADVTAVEGHVVSILKQIGRDPFSISRTTIKQFCKNSRNLRVRCVWLLSSMCCIVKE